MKKDFLILTINPGSTSTKIGVFKNENNIFETTVRHSSKMLDQYAKIWDQYSFRKEEIISTLEQNKINLKDLDAVVGRGGLIKPIPSGVYYIDEEMIEDARCGIQGHHASNLGCVIAYSIGWEYNIPALIVDPPAVDDFEPLARISGFKEIERTSLLHALNIFATSRTFATQQKKKFEDLNLIVAHLGGGITVTALRKGKAINANHGLDEGPFTPERSGKLPLIKFMKLCLSGKYTEEQLKKFIAGKGGLVSYFNTNKSTDVENMVKAGSEKYRLVFEAMAYQIAEEIGARATNLHGKVDGIIITGGIANSNILMEWIKERVSHIADVHIFPGELELEALAMGGLRVLRGEETAKFYTVKTKKIGIYYWDSLEVYVSAINTIENYFREKGYKFREDENNLEIEYVNCKSNEDKARSGILKLSENNHDVIFTIGSPASVRAVQYLKEPTVPVICSGIYNTKVLGDINFEANNNYYATCYAPPINEIIENTVLKINPKVKKIGLMYKIGELQSDIQRDEIKKFCKTKNIELVSYDIQAQEDFKEAAKYFLSKNIEWLFLGADTIIASSNEKQLDEITKKIPTVCILDTTVKYSGLIAYHANWDTVIKNSAELAFKLFNNQQVTNNIIKPTEKHLVVNRKTAEKFNLINEIEKLKDVIFI